MLATSTPMSLHRSTKDDGFTVDVVSAEGVFLRSDRQKLSVAR
jgi:hypothetical protein